MNETPPSNLTLEEQAKWWRKHGANMDGIKTLDGLERKCPRCESNNPCSGNDTCIVCGESLKNAEKVFTTQHCTLAQNY
ncbi:hypothetical protein KJ707_04595 [Patescibacteria group bacterium]|nr:hypothetical protein [Patescibacteria group bacterium]